MLIESIWEVVKLNGGASLLQWAKVGETNFSEVPTFLWGIGGAALAYRLLNTLFRRFLFRRVPIWEIILQNLLFIWMVIYSLHFWMLFVKMIKFTVQYLYNYPTLLDEDYQSCKLMEQWVIWMLSIGPLLYCFYTRPRPESPPVMIWITTNPWLRREMGPQGYYLTRPLSLQQAAPTNGLRSFVLRRAFSDSKIIEKVPPKKKRHSKSV